MATSATVVVNPQQQQQQQQQYVTIQQARPRSNNGCCGDKVYDNYKATTSRALGWVQIVAAILCIIFNSVAIHAQADRTYGYSWYGYSYGYGYNHDNYNFYSGYGIWSPIFYIVSGGFAIGAAIHKNTCMIVTNMVLSIISAVFGFSAFCTACASVGYEMGYSASSYQHDTVSTLMAWFLVLLLLAAFVVTIWSSALSCGAVCCGQRYQNTATTAPVAVAVIHHQQPMGTVPQYQQPAPQPQQQMAMPPPYQQQPQQAFQPQSQVVAMEQGPGQPPVYVVQGANPGAGPSQQPPAAHPPPQQGQGYPQKY